MVLTDISVIKSLLARHGFTFSKAMGQNFLINPSVCPRMAEEGGAEKGTGVLEIGPGIGVLTAQLARRAEKVAAVELDGRLLPILAETLSEFQNVEIIHGDVLKLDLAGLIESRFSGLRCVVCANLPYYITTPILMALLERRLPIESITVMVQREAAGRLCARPGERECGAVSAAVWYYSVPQKLFPVSRGSFLPAPEVDSSVIRLDVRKEPPVRPADEARMFQVVKAAFSQRRKTAANALSAGLGLPKAEILSLFSAMGIAQDVRAERMTLQNFSDLSDLLG
ncbi:MAG TPA: 16S rRNA (adenine(1518)-N(6)/adenine(1519)-N(6))-dimethyltransferase RsmA [Candidatus Fimivivens faecavium]|nr:16S rRNA (adenine(1518)-N(6)/adenine(1519)-N(6))-dimethyltransferase RsmA [Candidatus Fimivivens faecavium]